MDNKLFAISIITDDMLTNPNVSLSLVISASKLAEEDHYLYRLMNDYMKETNDSKRNDLLRDVLDYTETSLRNREL